MTRKDYALIAGALERAEFVGDPNQGSPAENDAFLRGYRQALWAAAVKLANDLSAENANFDRDRFLRSRAGLPPV